MTALVGAGYILVWALIGMAVLALGAALATVEMQQPALARLAPIAAAGVVMFGGAVQFTHWKVRRLQYCTGAFAHDCRPPGNAINALQHGLRLGLRCGYCCANLTAIILVIGVMDLRVMGVATAVISIERIAPISRVAARFSGALIIGSGLILSARAVALSP